MSAVVAGGGQPRGQDDPETKGSSIRVQSSGTRRVCVSVYCQCLGLDAFLIQWFITRLVCCLACLCNRIANTCDLGKWKQQCAKALPQEAFRELPEEIQKHVRTDWENAELAGAHFVAGEKVIKTAKFSEAIKKIYPLV